MNAVIPVSVMVTGKGTVSSRIKGHYSRKRPSKFTEIFRPVIFWNITYKCNLRCSHCYIDATLSEKPGELNEEELLRIADDIVKHGIPLVVVTGGEPLASKKFWVLAEYLSSTKKPKWSLSTNGTLIDEDVATKLATLGVSYVGVSLDSVNPLEHDRFRGVRGAFEAAIRGIRESLAAGLDTGIRMTLTKTNIDGAHEILKMARDLGVQRVSLYLLDSIGRASNMLTEFPTHEQMKNLADKLIKESKTMEGEPEVLIVRGNFIGIYVADKLSRSREDFLEYLRMIGSQGDCGRKTLSIYPDGRVKPCQFLEQYTIGNLKTQKISDILSPRNKLLAPFLKVYEMLGGKKCSNCPFKIVCGGGSRNRAYIATGDFWGDDPLCFLNPLEIANKWNIDEEDVASVVDNHDIEV